MRYLLSLILVLMNFALAAQIDSDAVREFVETFETKYGRPIDKIMEKAQYQQEIIDKISRPAEGTMTWERYRNIFMKEERIAAGVDFWNEHQDVISQVTKVTGVPAEVILGIIGVETYFGRIKGSYKVLDALYTLGFGYPKRAKFFKSELEKFLVLAQTENLDVYTVEGSYAGAMGYSQFMPSSYIAYAKSYEPEGNADLMNSPEDAIASVANYIKVHRWQEGAPIAAKANFTREVSNLNKQVIRPKNNLSDYTKIGIVPENEIKGDPKATLVKLDDDYWFGFENFYVITRYNHSPMYAMAVFELGSAIVNRKP